LAELANPDLTVQARAIHQLCKAPEVRAVAPLLRVCRRHPKQGGEIMSMILSLRDPGVIEPLLPFLTERDVRFRELAAQALAQFDDPRVFEPLRGALNDPSPAVRAAAAAWFTRSSDPGAAGVLAEHRAQREAERAREQAAFLASLAEPGGLARALQNPNPYLRRTAAEQVSRRRPTEDYPALFAAVEDGDRGVRDAVYAAILGLRDPAAEPHLRGLLGHPNAAVRRLGVQAWGALRGSRAWPELQAAFRDPDGAVRMAAVELAGRWADDRTIDRLIPLLDDRDAGVRAAAHTCLVEATGQDYAFVTDDWYSRPRLYGLSNAPFGRWTLTKLLLLWLAILGMKAWADAAESIQLRELMKGVHPPHAGVPERGRTRTWTRHYARQARVERREDPPRNGLFVIMQYLRPRGGSVLYYAGVLALGTAWQIPAAALQRDALLAAGASHIYFELLTRVEDDRFFWTLTLAVSVAVAVI
jgi:HEAT repeat protein